MVQVIPGMKRMILLIKALKKGCGKILSDQSEPVKRYLRAYIEDWEKLSTKKNDQRTRTSFLAKYVGLSLYDIGFGKRYYIDYEDIHFVK